MQLWIQSTAMHCVRRWQLNTSYGAEWFEHLILLLIIIIIKLPDLILMYDAHLAR
jgi:hypothetical protein